MPDRDSDNSVYTYSIGLTALLFGVLTAVSPIILYMLTSSAEHGDLVGLLLSALMLLFPIFLFPNLLSRASIAVNDEGIAASIFGFRTRTLQWRDVKKIRKVRSSNGYNFVDSFHVMGPQSVGICTFLVNLCGNIVFTQDVSGLRDLLSQVNFYARRHEIPLVVWSIETAGANLREKHGRAYWRQAIAPIEEKRVTEF